ncbi:MAG TPA: carboxypeptidase regulatory-like domain-containing protein [Candidatus Aquilonibacter sp.]|nr:carboxypeptidase regulatory-like domain-containing protein [Candidatus Aquilonibacter sp.]
MSTAHIRSFFLAALALVAFSGHIVDATTGQSMPKLSVHATGPSRAAATTDAHGRFLLKGLKPGTYTLRVESDDVPPQEFDMTVKPGSSATVTFKVCSMTLDYHCVVPGGGA